MSTRATPQVHLIGEIKNAYGFAGNRLYCKYSVRVGHQWTHVSGKSSGETYEEILDEVENEAQWDHPFDLHYLAKTVRGWPKFLVEVWIADNEGRYSIGGYGVGSVPVEAGQHTVKIHCWRPKPQGYFRQLAADLLGI